MSDLASGALGDSQTPARSSESGGRGPAKKRRRKPRRGSEARNGGHKRQRGADQAPGAKILASDNSNGIGETGEVAASAAGAGVTPMKSGTSGAGKAAAGGAPGAGTGYVVGRKSKKAVKRMRAGTMQTAATPAALQAYRRKFGCSPRVEMSVLHSAMTKRQCDMLSMPMIRQMVIWALQDCRAPWWLQMKNRGLVSQLVVVHVLGVSASTIEALPEAPPFLASTSAVPTRMCKSRYLGQCVENLLYMEKKHKATVDISAAPFPPSHYCLKLDEMERLGFPSPSDAGVVCVGAGGAGGEAETAGADGAASGDGAQEHLLGIDCEMVLTSEGRELARVTVVDQALETVYDTLVQPPNPVRDYLTEYSGITAGMLEGVTTTLEDVQRALLGQITPRTILVGHSLEHDMRALKMCHSRVLDTTLLYPHPSGPPSRSSLKFLAKRYLNTVIQDSVEGHDSCEDATAAMKLALLKVANGPGFGNPFGGGGPRPHDVSILTRFERADMRSALVGPPSMVAAHVCGSADAIPCQSWAAGARSTMALARRATASRPRFVLAQWNVSQELERAAAHGSAGEQVRASGAARASGGGEHAGDDAAAGTACVGAESAASDPPCPDSGARLGTNEAAGAGAGAAGASLDASVEGAADNSGDERAGRRLGREPAVHALVQEVDTKLQRLYDALPEHAMLVVLAQGPVSGLVDTRGHVKRCGQEERDALAAEAQLGVAYFAVKNSDADVDADA